MARHTAKSHKIRKVEILVIQIKSYKTEFVIKWHNYVIYKAQNILKLCYNVDNCRAVMADTAKEENYHEFSR